MLKFIKNSIPNTITCLNLVSGCMAIFFSITGKLEYAFMAIVAAALFDFLDGMAARALKAYSDMGKQLDSLSDVVSFGVAPGFVMIAAFTNILNKVNGAFSINNLEGASIWLLLIPLLIPVFSALRLAKFNLLESDPGYFIGLAVPANALFLSSLAFIHIQYPDMFSATIWLGLFIFLIVLTSALMVSNIPMLSLKFKNLSWKENHLRFIFLICSLIAIVLFKLNAFPAIMVIYFVVSFFIKPTIGK